MAIYLGTDKVSLAGTNGGYGINGRLFLEKTYSFNLGQTNYSSITRSTTAQSLTLPATTYTTGGGTTITCFRIGENYDGTKIDFNNHDYVGFTDCVIEYNYGTNTVTGTLHPIRCCQCRDYQEGRYFNSVNSSTGILNTTTTPTKNSSYIQASTAVLYQKADNTFGIVSSGSGIYHSGTGAISWVTGSNYIDLKMGAISVIQNTNYAPEEALALVNPANTIITMNWHIYECDKASNGNIYSQAFALAANH